MFSLGSILPVAGRRFCVRGIKSINSNLGLKAKPHSKSELSAVLSSMVHKSKAQQQAEFAELAEVLFIAVLETGDKEDHGLLDINVEDDEEWQPG